MHQLLGRMREKVSCFGVLGFLHAVWLVGILVKQYNLVLISPLFCFTGSEVMLKLLCVLIKIK